MFEEKQGESFGELPQALVDEIMEQSLSLADELRGGIEKIQGDLSDIREKLQIHTDREISPSSVPTSCGIDGSYLVERLLSTDLAGYAALAIEGITPPSEKRHWPEPHHVSGVFPIEHHDTTTQLVRGSMMANELVLADDAPHEIILLDYGLRTPIIYLNNATSNFPRAPQSALREQFPELLDRALDGYLRIAEGERRDQISAGVPKYSALRELSDTFGLGSDYDDRTIATFALEAGEYVGPIPVAHQGDLHLTLSDELREMTSDSIERRDRLLDALDGLHVVYYKPRPYLPAFRLEIANSVANNDARLGNLLKAIEYQCASASVLEPFPLYLADRMVKHLSSAFPAFLQAVVHEMATEHEGEVGEIYLAMHSYRSEAGR